MTHVGGGSGEGKPPPVDARAIQATRGGVGCSVVNLILVGTPCGHEDKCPLYLLSYSTYRIQSMVKNKRILAYAFTVFIPLLVLTTNKCFSQNVEDVSGFRNTSWDMGVEEVSDSLEAKGIEVEKASSPSNEEDTGYENIPDSLNKMVDKATLKVEDYQISNLSYKVEFYFSEDESLLSEAKVIKEDGTSASFEILSKLMVKKYGKPTSTGKDRTDIGSYGELKKSKTWVFPTTTIELSFRSGYDSPDVSGETTLRYTPTEGESTSKI